MIAQLLAVAVTLLIGVAAERLTGRRSFTGLWYLYGTGVLALTLQWLPWSRGVIVAVVAAAAVSLALAWFRPREAAAGTTLSPVDAATALVLAVFASFATASALWEWDAWAIWALKARVFFVHQGIDWQFLTSTSNDFAHADYPLLVPSALALPSILTGTWDDRWLGVVTVAILVSATLAVRQITAREFSPALSASIALAFASLGSSRYVSTAETPFIAFAVCALAFLRAGEWRHASILLGLAAITKNEGLALMAAVAAGLVLSRRARNLVRLWPSLVIVLPWFGMRAIHGISTDIVSGSVLARAARHLGEAGEITRLLFANTDLPLLWIALVVAIPFAWRRERLLSSVVAVQALFAMAAYFVTPYDLAWHIANSWNRLSRQLAAMAALAILAGLARELMAGKAAGQAANRGKIHVEQNANSG